MSERIHSALVQAITEQGCRDDIVLFQDLVTIAHRTAELLDGEGGK